MSAVQMIAAATAIANGGDPPQALRRERVPGARRVRCLRQRATARAAGGLRRDRGDDTVGDGDGVERRGDGQRAKVSDIRMAVKTGTAQMIDPETQRYSEKDYIASTLAIFPADAPRVIVYLAIVKPTLGPSYYGGRIAAPARQGRGRDHPQSDRYPARSNPTVSHPDTVDLPPVKPIAIGDTMPDLKGVPKRLLMPLLERKDISVKMSGEGYVVSQSPSPGAPVAPGAELTLEFR